MRLDALYTVNAVNMLLQKLGKSVYVIDDGEIVLDGTPKEVFKNVEKLKSLGLDVPQVTELAYELRKMGIEISDDVLTVDECFDEIIRILGETKR